MVYFGHACNELFFCCPGHTMFNSNDYGSLAVTCMLPFSFECARVHMHVCVYVCMYVHACVCACVCVCVCACMCDLICI